MPLIVTKEEKIKTISRFKNGKNPKNCPRKRNGL